MQLQDLQTAKRSQFASARPLARAAGDAGSFRSVVVGSACRGLGRPPSFAAPFSFGAALAGSSSICGGLPSAALRSTAAVRLLSGCAHWRLPADRLRRKVAAGLGCQVFWLHQRRTLFEPTLSMTARATRLQVEGS